MRDLCRQGLVVLALQADSVRHEGRCLEQEGKDLVVLEHCLVHEDDGDGERVALEAATQVLSEGKGISGLAKAAFFPRTIGRHDGVRPLEVEP